METRFSQYDGLLVRTLTRGERTLAIGTNLKAMEVYGRVNSTFPVPQLKTGREMEEGEGHSYYLERGLLTLAGDFAIARNSQLDIAYYTWLNSQNGQVVGQSVALIRTFYEEVYAGWGEGVRDEKVLALDGRYSLIYMSFQSFSIYLNTLLDVGLDPQIAANVFKAFRRDMLSDILPWDLDGDSLTPEALTKMSEYGILYEEDLGILLAGHMNYIYQITNGSGNIFGMIIDLSPFPTRKWTEWAKRTVVSEADEITNISTATIWDTMRAMKSHEVRFNMVIDFISMNLQNGSSNLLVTAIKNFRDNVVAIVKFADSNMDYRTVGRAWASQYWELIKRMV